MQCLAERDVHALSSEQFNTSPGTSTIIHLNKDIGRNTSPARPTKLKHQMKVWFFKFRCKMGIAILLQNDEFIIDGWLDQKICSCAKAYPQDMVRNKTAFLYS
jgi:hypothetical protein